MRKITQESALDMLIECGERSVRKEIEKCHSVGRSNELNKLKNAHWTKASSIEDEIVALALLLDLNCLAEALDKIFPSNGTGS